MIVLNKITSHSFEFPATKKKDVVVVGGGPAGCLAALSARRNGADTLLIERDSYLGGMMTGGLITSLHGYRLHKDHAKYVPTSSWDTPLLVRGISLEVCTRLQEAGGTIDQGHTGDPSTRENYDPEVMIRVLDEMMEESGVDVLFNTLAFDAVVEDGAVRGVAVANKSGGQVILADVVVDASGDADIAAAAGVPFEYGRKEDGRLHGGSLLMDVGGIDVDRYIEYVKSRPEKTEEERERLQEETSRLMYGGSLRNEAVLTVDGKRGYFNMGGPRGRWKDLERDRSAGRYIRVPGGLAEEWIEYIKSGEVPQRSGVTPSRVIYPRPPRGPTGSIRHGKMRYDQTRMGVHEEYFDQKDQEEISRAIVRMRRMNWIYVKFLRERIPGFEDAYVLKTSPMVGTRESRRIVGEYMVTEEDCEEGRRFPDVIAKSGRALNVHSVTGIGAGVNIWIEPKRPYDLPYRCLVPRRIDNLLVAGRCSSFTHVALGGARAEPPCMTLGEAAGAAAALSSRLGVAPRALDVRLLQRALLEQGVLLFLEDERELEKKVLSYSTG